MFRRALTARVGGGDTGGRAMHRAHLRAHSRTARCTARPNVPRPVKRCDQSARSSPVYPPLLSSTPYYSHYQTLHSARPTPRTDALIKYYDKRFNNRGRDYAYVLPAMTRAIQAAGRPVRRLDDRGVIVLLDQRFGTPYLKRFIPSWLVEVTETVPDSPDNVSKKVQEFFNRST